jgi:predicted signal transduction protein with EAL and GGDEF domain
VARVGGDEFVLVLPLTGDGKDAAWVAKKALDVLAQPFLVEGHALHISGSIGISICPDDGSSVDTLMRTADTAMYRAKESGRSNIQFFTPELNRAAQQRFDVNVGLRQALARDEFVLHYQPQVDMESGTTFSTEALLRWQRPGAAPVSCGEFIANAEQSGLIVPIGEWVLRQACRQLSTWRDAGHTALKMAVNLSPRQLEQADFCLLVGKILNEAGVPAAALELEITEGILLRRSECNLGTLTQLSDMGIQLTVDDFGTGYSSLAYLQRFPVNTIKIDQSFVLGIGKDPNNTALVAAIIAMAASLKVKVIAEGVETMQQAQFPIAWLPRSARLLLQQGRAGAGAVRIVQVTAAADACRMAIDPALRRRLGFLNTARPPPGRHLPGKGCHDAQIRKTRLRWRRHLRRAGAAAAILHGAPAGR